MGDTLEAVRSVTVTDKLGATHCRYAIQDKQLRHWYTGRPLSDLAWSREAVRRRLWESRGDAETALDAIRDERKRNA